MGSQLSKSFGNSTFIQNSLSSSASTFSSMHPMLKVVFFDFAVQWGCFAVAATLKTEKFYDLSGALTYLTLFGMTYFGRNTPASSRQFVNTALSSLWATRLGSFLFYRVMKVGEDKRFEKVKHRPRVFFIYWTMQAVWILLTALPIYILNTNEEDPAPLNWRDYAGWGLWAAGFLTECAADFQKNAFRSNPANNGKWCDKGLYKYVRYPNYAGEITLWIGTFLSCSNNLRGWQWIALASPIFVSYLLTRVSGIPILERKNKKVYGSNPAYQEYVKKTKLLFPGIF